MAVVIGFLLVRLANPADKLEPRGAAFLLELALGAGGGIALVSFLFFLLLMLHAASPPVMLPTEAVLLLTSAGLVFIPRRRTAQDPCRRTAGFWWYWILSGALVVSVLAVTAALVKLAQWREFLDTLGLKHLCHHGLRTTFITRAALAGVPEAMTRRFVNHASSQVHHIYQKITCSDIMPMFDALLLTLKAGAKTSC